MLSFTAYLDLSRTSTDTATLTFTLGDSANNKYKIKVTQYSCTSDLVSQQTGCFQYHTGTMGMQNVVGFHWYLRLLMSGVLQSYNFAGGLQIASQNYKNCIRQEAGHCCIQYTSSSYALSPTACTSAPTTCTGATVCGPSTEYIIIPGGSSSASNGASSTSDRYRK